MGRSGHTSLDTNTAASSGPVGTFGYSDSETGLSTGSSFSHGPEVEAVAEVSAAMTAGVPSAEVGPLVRPRQSGYRASATGLRERVRSLDADEPAGYAAGSEAALKLGQMAEAEAILVEGVERFPGDVGLAGQFANMAAHRREWGEALTRWSQFRMRFPDHPAGFVGAAWAFREQGQTDLAEILLTEAARRFPDHPDVLRDRATVAHLCGDWGEAAARWARVRAVSPDVPGGYGRGAEAQAKLGAFAEADALLLAGMERFPDDWDLVVGFAEIAGQHGDWPEALRRWMVARRRFPLDRHVQARLFETRMRIVGDDPDAAARADAELAAPEDRHMRTVMMACESLGGARFGCEFGGVQRAFWAEPLGLLRWADADPAHLIAALEQRFEGLGLAENTEVFTYPSGASREYGVRDTRFNLGMHTFVDVASASADAMLHSVGRRMQFLRRKLIEDLESGAKLFVYKLTYRTLTVDELDRLYAAVRSYGPATLLYVRTTDAEHPDGTVERVKPGLLVGYLDHFSVSADDQPLTMPVEAWGRVCALAYELWQAGRDEDADTAPVAPRGDAAKRGRAANEGARLARWNPTIAEQLRRDANEPGQGELSRRLRAALLAAGTDAGADLRLEVEAVAGHYLAHDRHDRWLFDNCILLGMVSGAFDIVERVIRYRYESSWAAEVVVERAQRPAPVLRWEVRSSILSRFVFDESAFQSDHLINIILFWARTIGLYDGYHRSGQAEVGAVDVNLWDAGMVPGIAFCDHRPGYFLAPDPMFVSEYGYRHLRAELDAGLLPWEERMPVAFWRGVTTGAWDGTDWRTLPRVRLCEIAAASDGSIDAGINSVVQMSRETAAEIRVSGLMRPGVPPLEFARHKYQIDVDGNSNSWPGLFHKLYSGSPGPKVGSPFDFRQWYYDRLIAWHNYVPVASDMGDLVEKVEWLRRNDDTAREIGRRGHELAASLNYEAEVIGAAPIISAALRQDAFLRSGQL